MFFPVIREVPSGLSLGIRLRGVNHVLFGTPLHGGGRYGSTRLRVDYRTEARAVRQVSGHHLETRSAERSHHLAAG